MRALIAAPGGRLRWRDVPAPPPPGPLGAVVHPIATSTCDLDCPLTLGATQLPLPLHLGHECVADVLAVGERVTTVKVGDRVVVPFQINCGVCEPCRAGRTGSCSGVPPISMYGMGFGAGHWGGAFSDQLAVPFADAMLVALPEGIDPVAAASVADNVCDAYRHIAPHLPDAARARSERRGSDPRRDYPKDSVHRQPAPLYRPDRPCIRRSQHHPRRCPAARTRACAKPRARHAAPARSASPPATSRPARRGRQRQ